MRELNDKDNDSDDSEGSSALKLFRKNTAKENQEVMRECVQRNEHVVKMRERMKAKYNVDIFDENKFPVHKRGFSWRKMKDKVESMREADTSSSFAQVLRAGVQTVVNRMYESVPTTFEDWAHVIQSSKNTELYAPLQGISFPGEVPEQGIYPESKALGLDIKLKNRKYGEIFPVTAELVEDDQTGQFSNQVGLIAEYLKQVLEILAYGKLASVASMQYSNLRVRTSETKPSTESTYPWSQAFVGGGKNRPASFGGLTQANVQAGMIALADQKNLLGLKMGVNPRRLLASHFYRFDASVLLNSAYYPSGAAAAGVVGGAFATNVLKGILDPTFSRFMVDNAGVFGATSKAWYIVDDTKPWFIVQIREAASVLQEAPNAGDSFNRDIMRFKGKTRCNADHIDPRFAWQGSDGSV